LGGVADNCGGNRHGLQCAHGLNADFAEKGEPCKSCDGSGSYVIIPAAIAIAAGIFVGFYAVSNSAKARALQRVSIASSFGVVISHAQLYAVIGMFEIHWPKYIKGLLNFLQVMVFQIEILRPTCIFGFSLGARYIPGLLVPVMACLLCGTIFVISVFGNRVSKRIPRMIGNDVLHTLGLLLSALFIGVCKCILNIFECRPNPSAQDTMRMYDGFLCHDDAMKPLLPATFVAIIFFIVGLPIVLCWAIKVRPARYHKDASFRRRFRFLFSKWNPRWYWWGLVVLCRNFLVSVINVITADGLLQLIFMLLVFLPCFIPQIMYHPWKEEALNYLDISMSASLVITVLLSIALLPEATSSTKDAIGVVMVVAITLALIVAVIVVLDMISILILNKSMSSRYTLDPHFQADFITTMLKFEMLFQLGQDEIIGDIEKFFGELPMADGKKVAQTMALIDRGLFGEESRKLQGIAPNTPRTDERAQRVSEKSFERSDSIRSSVSDKMGQSDDPAAFRKTLSKQSNESGKEKTLCGTETPDSSNESGKEKTLCSTATPDSISVSIPA
jgi:hypothetical protein